MAPRPGIKSELNRAGKGRVNAAEDSAARRRLAADRDEQVALAPAHMQRERLVAIDLRQQLVELVSGLELRRLAARSHRGDHVAGPYVGAHRLTDVFHDDAGGI